MKQRIVLAVFCGLLSYLLSSYSGGAAANGLGNRTGAKGGTTGCAGGCHGSTTLLGVVVELDSAGTAVTSYHPGVAYTVKISATNNTAQTNLSHYGFQLSVVGAANAGTTSATQAGTWGTLPTSTHNTTAQLVVEQSTALAATTGTGAVGTTYVESVPWTAPVAGTGSVKLYGLINAVNYNGNNDSRDLAQVATAVTITEAVSAASVHIAQTSGTNPTCAGSSVTFTATPTNGGTAPTYQWKIGTTNVGTNSPTFTTTALTTGQVVTCVMTSSLSGVTGSPATSNAITMTINPTVTPSVTISTPNATICAGSSDTFTAAPTNGGTPSYQWKVDTTNVGTNSPTFVSSSLTNGQVVTCVMTSTATCASPATATSNAITVTVTPTATPSVSISAARTAICASSADTFTATPINGGTASYQWRVGTTNVGTNSPTYITSSLTNSQVVTCVMTATGCVSPSMATSNPITVTVTPSVTPSVHIAATSTNLCTGGVDTFTATPTNGGTPSYQWRVGTTNVGSNSPTFVTSSLTNGQVVTCVMTSTAGCASPASVTSNAITITVGNITPTISVQASSTSICTGAADTFTATITNGGTSPSFQWRVGTANVGTNSSTFITSALTNGQVVTCVLTSSSPCASPSTATSAGVTITVNATVAPTLAIATRTDTICAGVLDSFIATGTHLGTAPSYQWQVTGSNAGSNSPLFSTSTLANGATVKCIVTSNTACAVPTSATSNAITMVVRPSPAVSINPSGALKLCAGDSLQLTASGGGSYHWSTTDTATSIWIYQSGTYTVSVAAGTGTCGASASTPAIVTSVTPVTPIVTKTINTLFSTPAVSYEWMINGTAITTDTARTLDITASGTYAVIITDTNGCSVKSANYIFSYTDTTHVDTTNGIGVIGADLGVRLYPVPNQGAFTVDANGLTDAQMTIYDIYGQKVYEQRLNGDHTLVADMHLRSAIYFVTISDHGRMQTIRMQVIRE